ncbi:Transmembrane protein 33 [Balamuthia mandrillaris]
MSTAQNGGYQAYLEYRWEDDPAWQQYVLNIEVPPGVDRESAVERVKRKYYLRNVDNSVVFPTTFSEPKQTSSSSSSSSSQSQSHTAASSSFSQRRGANAGAQSPSSPASAATPPTTPTFTATHPAASDTAFSATVQRFLSTLWLITNVILLGNVVGFLFGQSLWCYYRVFFCAAAIYAIDLYSTFGFPRLQLSYLHTITQHSSGRYLLLCLIFAYHPRPIFLMTLVITIYSLLNLSNYLINVMPQNRDLLFASFIERQARNLTLVGPQLLRMAAFTEVLILPFLIFYLFADGEGFLLLLLYIQFLASRYQTNAPTRDIVQRIASQTDTVIMRYAPPSLREGYLRFKRSASNWVVDFQRKLQERMMRQQ